MSTVIISRLVRFTGFLVIAAVTAFLSNTVNADSVPLLIGGFTHPRPPVYFDNAPDRLKRIQPHIDPSEPLIRCYCDLPECLIATDGMPFCHTRQGCFSRIQTSVSELTGSTQVTDSTTITTTDQPLPEEFDEEPVMSNTINGTYGCLDLLPTNQTCNEMLELTDSSEFLALSSANTSETVYAYYCCQNNMCNDRANPATTTIQEVQEVQEEQEEKTFQSSLRQRKSKRATKADSETVWLTPYTNPDAVAPKVTTDINAESEVPTSNIKNTKHEIDAIIKPTINKCFEPVMYSKLQNTATADRLKTLRKKVKISSSEENFKTMQWMASFMSGNFEKTAPTEITKTPNTMQFPSTTSKHESSQHNKPIFVAPEEFPTNSVYPPIYHRKTNFSIADFIRIVNIVKSLKPKVNGFPDRHNHVNEERKGAGQVSHLERVQDGHTSSSQIRCYCNLRQCMSSFSSVPVCYTSQGCFTQVTTSFSNFPGPSLLAIANITTTQSGKFNERLDVSNDQHSYGCQELLPTKSFNLTEYSTFPTLPSVNSSKIVLTYHCCQDDLCNIRIDSIIITKRDVHEAQKSEFQSLSHQHKALVNDENMKMKDMIDYPTFTKRFDSIFSDEFGKVVADDNEKTSMDNKKNTDDFLKFMKLFDYVVSIDFKKSASSDNEKTPARNKRSINAEKEIMKWFDVYGFVTPSDYKITAPNDTVKNPVNNKENVTIVRNKKSISAVNDYVTPSDFKTTAPNDTTNIPINNQENFTIGEILKFMKSLNFTITDDSEMTAFTNTKVTQTNDKESITMGEIIEFLKWFSPVISVDSNKTADADTAQTLVRNKKSISAVNDYVTPSDFKTTAPNDTTSKPINNRENVTIGKILKFMKWFEPAISVEFDKIVAADTAKTTTNKKKIVDGILKIMKSFNFTVSDYFENITFANTEETHTNEKENIAIGEVLKFMKLFDYGVSIGFKASADTSKTPTRNKRSTGMVDTHKFKNNALILPGFVEMTATSDDITKIKKNKNKDINSILLSLFPIITNDFKKTALTNTAKIPIINKKINDTANVLQVKKWLESIVSDDFEKAVPTNTANTMTNNKKNSNVGDILKVMKWLDIAMSSDFRKIASVDNANLPMNNKKTSDMIDVPKVIKWFESVIPGDSEKIALADHLKTPNTMELPSTTVKGELSQYKSIFVAPEEFPTSSVYTPIYYMKPDFPAADFQMMVKIIKSMIPEVKGFPGRIIINRHLHEERK
ncbi:Hypothetical protein CINCED_3A005852, partial [Cinara cedri]